MEASAVPNITEILLTNYQASKQDRGLEIHCSDLSSCPRRTCFQRLQTDRHEDRQTLKNYLIGALFHEKLEQLLGANFVCEQPIKWVGKSGITVIATPDAVFVDPSGDKIVVEVKTTNSRLILMDDEPSFVHRKQLLQYMSILGVTRGIILCIFLDNKIKEPFREHLVTFEYDNESADILEELEHDAIELAKGVMENDPSLVKHVANNINFLGSNGVPWICRYCDFKEQCDDFRRADGEEVIDVDIEPKTKKSASIDKLITSIKLKGY